MNQLTDKQLIFLDNLVYLDLSNYDKSNTSIREAIEIILQVSDGIFGDALFLS